MGITKGKWIAVESIDATSLSKEKTWNVEFRTIAGSGGMIAEVGRYPEAEADARLIAAAPDLLAACKILLGMAQRNVSKTDWDKKTLDKISDIISQADKKE